MQIKNKKRFIFSIDRGGTFTDFYVQQIHEEKAINAFCFKVLSQGIDGQGPIVGIKNFLTKILQQQYASSQQNSKIPVKLQKIPAEMIQKINLGTTLATNSLLQRKGDKNAIILTKGFIDLLQIRHQSRPNIFDLSCKTHKPLYTKVYQINQRVYLNDVNDNTLQQIFLNKNQKQEKIKNNSIFCKKSNQQQLLKIIQDLKKQNIKSVSISFCNSYIYNQNQLFVKSFLQKNGIQNVQIGSSFKDLGYLKRSETCNLDGFLNMRMKRYFNQFLENFTDKIDLRIMKSNGNFCRIDDIKASQLLLSGPAGGLIAYSQMVNLFERISQSQNPIKSLVGIDMGGTSTDVSRMSDQNLDLTYNFELQGIQICTPHLLIDTIAAGGGSKLTFNNGMFKVGPQSVGSNPGPVCYGIGDQLAITDANLVLNRLDIQKFPKIFGKNKDQPLNRQKSVKAMQKITQEINDKTGSSLDIFQVAKGFIQIANQLMAKSARKLLTLGKPDAIVMFGSAGGQHCCDLARKIGVDKVFIHKYSGILSAFGLSRASIAKQQKIHLGVKINSKNFKFQDFIQRQINHKISNKQEKNQSIQIYDEIKKDIGVKYDGTSNILIVPFTKTFIQDFINLHKKQNGFILDKTQFYIDFYKETKIKKQIIFEQELQQGKILQQQQIPQKFSNKKTKKVYLKDGWKQISIYQFSDMKNFVLKGPALILSDTSSVLVQENWQAKVTNLAIYLKYNPQKGVQKLFKNQSEIKCDSIKLTLYATRLMSIAQQMGKVLQKVSISTNIKQRLDFSCGIFDQEGKLLANAPHLPVHLGSMQTTVTQQIKRGIKQGDVVLTNHPQAGGSHLPDLTVVTCVKINPEVKLYLASRGHHADIGGSTPGSMPPFSKLLSQEGVAIETFHLIDKQKQLFKQSQLRQLFKSSRRVDDNVSDIKAQVAANDIGTHLLKVLVQEVGSSQFKAYLNFINDNACEAVKELLYNFSIQNNLKQIDNVQAEEFMDDGTLLKLKMTVDRIQKRACFDFQGTGIEVMGNTNAPKAITRSAILYCLRCLIGTDMPLNSGCLRPIEIFIPQNTILSPSKNAAVVGGNVETSQRLVDLILKPFQRVAASYGTMNNFLFGNENCCYYQTICGGSGAGQNFNGTTVQCHMTNTRITDVQHLQAFYPIVLNTFCKNKNSKGEGLFSGGQGSIRQFMFLQPMEISILSQRRVFQPYGIKGGKNGKRGINKLISTDKIVKNLGGKCNCKIKQFEIIRIQTPGGGGYGKLQNN